MKDKDLVAAISVTQHRNFTLIDKIKCVKRKAIYDDYKKKSTTYHNFQKPKYL